MTPRVVVALAGLLPILLMYANRGAVIALALAALAGAWDVVRRRRFAWPPRSVLVLLALALLWGAATAAWEETRGLALPKALQLAALAGGGLLVMAGLATEPAALWRPRLLVALRIGLVAAAGLITLEWATDMALSITLKTWAAGKAPPPSSILIGSFKSAASIMAMLAVLAGGMDLAARRWVPAALSLGAAVLAVHLTGSLGGMVGLAVAVPVALIALISTRLAALAVVAGLATLMALAPLAAFAPDTKELAARYPFLPNSAVHRSAIWQFAADKALERPLLGWGLDASRELPGGQDHRIVWLRLPDRMDPQMQQILPLHPHNFAVQVWLEVGGIGALLFLALMAETARRAARRRDGGTLLAGLACTVIIAAVAFGIWQSWWVATLWLVAALAAALSAPERDSVPA